MCIANQEQGSIIYAYLNQTETLIVCYIFRFGDYFFLTHLILPTKQQPKKNT